ncbi:hemolysin family protein [bacterium]|nr:hemolysin family protein [bacterium]MBU1636734.1 hemolysin family protein [bacterium]MBU1919600.1 hemolysin family protein [bacterium]
MDILIWTILCFLLSVFYSGMEIAYTSFDKIILEGWKKSGRIGIRALEFLSVKSDRFLMTSLIGTNLSNVAFATLVVIWAEKAGISSIAVMVASPLFILLFAEIIPKLFAYSSANLLVRIGSYPLFVSHILFYPFRWCLRPVVHIAGRLPRTDHKSKDKRINLRSEIDQILSEAEAEGALNEREGELLLRYLNARDIRVREVMTPRTKMIAIKHDATVEEAVKVFEESRHNVLPVYEIDLDHITGCIHSRDLLRKRESISEIIQPLPAIPESKRIVDQLEQFKFNELRVAIVVDEHGGTDGIVGLKDIISALVGPVGEAWEAHRSTIKRIAPGKFLTTGSVSRDELASIAHWRFPEGDFSTLSGWVTSIKGGIPTPGEQFEIDGVIVRVLASTPMQTEALLVSIPQGNAQDEQK